MTEAIPLMSAHSCTKQHVPPSTLPPPPRPLGPAPCPKPLPSAAQRARMCQRAIPQRADSGCAGRLGHCSARMFATHEYDVMIDALGNHRPGLPTHRIKYFSLVEPCVLLPVVETPFKFTGAVFTTPTPPLSSTTQSIPTPVVLPHRSPTRGICHPL